VAAARQQAIKRQGAVNAFVPADALNDMMPMTPQAARLIRAERQADQQGYERGLAARLLMEPGAEILLQESCRKYRLLSDRRWQAVHRVARTVADLQDAGGLIDVEHVTTALALRGGQDGHWGRLAFGTTTRPNSAGHHPT
jgi:predicted ATPase with chaperone activity